MSSRTEETFAYRLNSSRTNNPVDGWYPRLMDRVRQLRHAAKWMADSEKSAIDPMRKYLAIQQGKLTKNSTRQEIANVYENIVAALLAEIVRYDTTGYEAYQEHERERSRSKRLGEDLQFRTEQAAEGTRRIILREKQILTLIDLIGPQPAEIEYYDLDSFYNVERRT